MPTSSQAASTERETFIRCPSCGSFVRTGARHCENCGVSLVDGAVTATSMRPEPPPTMHLQSQESQTDSESYQRPISDSVGFQREMPPTRVGEATSPFRNEKTTPSWPGFDAHPSMSNSPRSSFRWWHGAILGLFILVFAGGLAAGGWWLWSSRDSAGRSPLRPEPTPLRSASPTAGSRTTIDKNSAGPSAEDELKELRVRRISARPSDGSTIVADLEAAENKYPTDFRFPYERAKLSIKGLISHHEAFEAIFLAGETAIDNGKAQAMLNDLMTDKDGDFYKMSRGHHEWETLEEALRNNDKSLLKIRH